MAKIFKTRHQLFLTEDLSKRLAHYAYSSGRARSEILVEALEAWFTRRGVSTNTEALAVRLTRIERNLDWLRRNERLVWEIMGRLVRQQLIVSAQSPPSRDALALGSKLFADFVDEIADRLMSKQSEGGGDPTLHALRSLFDDMEY
jgi:predicted transcriptional regulator